MKKKQFRSNFMNSMMNVLGRDANDNCGVFVRIDLDESLIDGLWHKLSLQLGKKIKDQIKKQAFKGVRK